MLHSVVSRPRWRVHGLGLLAAIVVMAVGVTATAPQAEAAVVTFEVEMIGANEVPAASSAGSGFARFTFNEETQELTYVVWMRGLSTSHVTASHIHRAPVGVAGPPIYTLASGPFSTLSGSIMLTEEDVADLEAGNLYVNIHSTLNPAGFARGQLALPSSAAPAPIAPPNTGDGGLAPSSTGFSWAGVIVVAGLAAVCLGLTHRGTRHT